MSNDYEEVVGLEVVSAREYSMTAVEYLYPKSRVKTMMNVQLAKKIISIAEMSGKASAELATLNHVLEVTDKTHADLVSLHKLKWETLLKEYEEQNGKTQRISQVYKKACPRIKMPWGVIVNMSTLAYQKGQLEIYTKNASLIAEMSSEDMDVILGEFQLSTVASWNKIQRNLRVIGNKSLGVSNLDYIYTKCEEAKEKVRGAHNE